MTTDRPDDRADEQIERAAKVMADQRGRNWRMMLSEYRAEHLRDARALAGAGLLSTPADQDNAAEVDWQAIADQAEQDMADWVRNCGDAEKRAERAEAEVERLNRMLQSVQTASDGWRGDNKALRVVVKVHDAARRQAEAERDQLRAQVAAVQELAEIQVAANRNAHQAHAVRSWQLVLDELGTAGGEQ